MPKEKSRFVEIKIMGVASIEKQINNYLPQLTVNQKKALLTVAKTFVEDEHTNDFSDDLKKELDNRYEEYMNGGMLVSEKEVNQRIKKTINGKTKR